MVGLIFVMVADTICGQYRPVQRSSLSRRFAKSYGLQVGNVCRHKWKALWEEKTWEWPGSKATGFTPDTNNHNKVVILVLHPTPLGEKWSGEH